MSLIESKHIETTAKSEVEIS